MARRKIDKTRPHHRTPPMMVAATTSPVVYSIYIYIYHDAATQWRALCADRWRRQGGPVFPMCLFFSLHDSFLLCSYSSCSSSSESGLHIVFSLWLLFRSLPLFYSPCPTFCYFTYRDKERSFLSRLPKLLILSLSFLVSFLF